MFKLKVPPNIYQVSPLMRKWSVSTIIYSLNFIRLPKYEILPYRFYGNECYDFGYNKMTNDVKFFDRRTMEQGLLSASFW
jgi:hypothetical protein